MNKRLQFYLFSCLFFGFLLTSKPARSQRQAISRYTDGDKVAFVGNSITQSGWYQHFIYVYYITRYPLDRVTFYNCGVGGDIAASILDRIEEDIVVFRPTHVNLMVGMNDVGRNLYQSEYTKNKDAGWLRQDALDRYAGDTEELVKELVSYTPNVTLIKPSIYDETAELEKETGVGVNNALNWCGAHLENLSHKYNTRITDFWTIMNTINESEQKKDKRFTLVGDDRIHPGNAGHFVMAYQFLKDQEVDRYVSKVAIDIGGETQINADYCAIEDFEKTDNTISFSALERSLPYPIGRHMREGLRYVPFVEDFNQQLLSVNGLSVGKYEIRIDDQFVGEFTSVQLSTGINLAELGNTPQMKQAQMVLKEAIELKAIQNKLRSLKRVEYRDLPRNMWGMPIDSLNPHFEHLLQTEYAERKGFATRLFDDYRVNKPREQALMDELTEKETAIYTLNKPRHHRFVIRPIHNNAGDE